MITKEQIEKHCVGHKISDLLYTKLDRDYKAEDLDYILPAGTVVEIVLWPSALGSLYVNSKNVDGNFPYDAATLLETEK